MTSTATPIKHDQHQRQIRRKRGTLRPLAAEVSCLSRADGSAKFTSGSTTVLAAVFGPASPKIPSRERPSGAILSVVFKHASKTAASATQSAETGTTNTRALSGYGATEREIERFIADALVACVAVKNYPRTVIEVVVQVISVDGSLVSTALNAATLALMDAGVEMNSLPVGTTCLVKTNGGCNFEDGLESNDGDNNYTGNMIKFDPSADDEANKDHSVIVLATDSVRDGVIASITLGTFQLDLFLSCVEGASRASKAVLAFMRIAVEQKVTREAKTLWSV